MSSVARVRHSVGGFRKLALCVEELEDRTVPTLLGQQLFPADNPWNQKITNAPVAANSAAVINSIISTDGNGNLHPDFGQDTDSSNDLYGIPYNVVHGNSTPRISVVIDAYPGESDLVPVPMPANPVIEGDYQNGPRVGVDNRGDSHLIVYDVDNNVAYEFYRASRPSENTDDQWHADQETVWNMATDTFRTIGWTSADAAGLSILAGLTRPDEALPVSQGGQGVITHALRMTLQNAVVLDQFLYPASHTANPDNTDAAVQVPMGARFRVKASVDISGLSPEAQIVAQALKDYGMIVADNGSNFYISGASYAVGTNNQQTLTWDDNDIQDPVHGLKSLPFSDFELVDLTPVVTGLSATAGPAGTSVTVVGQNFSGAAGHLQVFFGGTPATSVTYIDDAHVAVVVPSGSGTVDVQVQSGVTTPADPNNVENTIFGYGISAVTAADQFTYGSAVTGPSSGYTPPSSGGSTMSSGGTSGGSTASSGSTSGSSTTSSGSTSGGSTTSSGGTSGGSTSSGTSGGSSSGGTANVAIVTTIGVVDPTETWNLRNTAGPGSPDIAPFTYGAAGWLPVAGDWGGTGTTTVGVFDQTTATWYLRDSNSPGAPALQFSYGAPGWIPVAGDWSGTGTSGIGVFDPATATWYLKNVAGAGAPNVAPFQFGAPGWLPVVGDWNGDGKASIGVVDPKTGIWYLRNSNSPGAPDITPFAFGAPGWAPLAGDWNGDGKASVGVFDPATATWYLRNSTSAGAPDIKPFAYGAPGWTPVVGDWNFAGLPQFAAGGEGPGSPALSSADLAGVQQAALTRLAGAGFDASSLAAVQFEAGVLPPGYLGLSFPAAGRVVVSEDAAGYGWFVDATPLQNEEFLPDGTAVAGSPASGRMDLLTVALHELGHMAGLPDTGGDGWMAETLPTGVRRLPSS